MKKIVLGIIIVLFLALYGIAENHQRVQNQLGVWKELTLDGANPEEPGFCLYCKVKELRERRKNKDSNLSNYKDQSERDDFIVGDISRLKLDSSYVFVPYDKGLPHSDPDIEAVFYKAVGKQDTFYYAIKNNGIIFLWAIVKGKYVRLLRDL